MFTNKDKTRSLPPRQKYIYCQTNIIFKTLAWFGINYNKIIYISFWIYLIISINNNSFESSRFDSNYN